MRILLYQHVLVLVYSSFRINAFPLVKKTQHRLPETAAATVLAASPPPSSSYSDNFLFDFHNYSQTQMQTKTNKLKVWNDILKQEQFTFLEWQDSFHRNGLSDFCPPMSANLNCLVVGDEGMMSATPPYSSSNNKLPWEEIAEATIVSLQQRESSGSQALQPTTAAAQRATDNVNTAVPVLASTHAAQYDCILDQGLMEAVLLAARETSTLTSPHQLLLEASTALREHGVYVLVTTQSLDKKQQQWLVESGQEVGLEWEFDLDGISDPGKGQVVSVGRRFNTGSMPSIGKLSRYHQM